jgi:hypothetical protein
MRKDEIKVIKRFKNEEVKATKIVLPKNENSTRHKIGRRGNSRTGKLEKNKFANNKVKKGQAKTL